MNRAQKDSNRTKNLQDLAKSAKFRAKYLQIDANQYDIFCQKSNGKPSLDELVAKAKTWPTGSEQRHRVCCEIMRHHGGLGSRLRNEVSRTRIEHGEILGFLWEAIIALPDRYDPRYKTKPSTILASITKSLAYKHLYATHYIGAVRVPERSPYTWACVGLNDDQSFACLAEIHPDAEIEWDRTIEIDSMLS